MEERMAVLVIRVGEVNGLVLKSPLYWESIEFLAKDEVSRGIFYALPDQLSGFHLVLLDFDVVGYVSCSVFISVCLNFIFAE
ncbi:hypothetical protein DY000_02035266 [Brassica cretica]|uniref:Uncharacterized protein n=1 Tax=Brassica cretica TaxID=69181 RepID=A0ABQ7DG06_BRACR|nr:hypothetical protein DY000_02035266 [Brassica cretica]